MYVNAFLIDYKPSFVKNDAYNAYAMEVQHCPGQRSANAHSTP